MFDPVAVHGVMEEYGIAATLNVSEEPDLEPHTIELVDSGLALVFEPGGISLLQVVDGHVHQRGEYNNLTEAIEAVREYLQ